MKEKLIETIKNNLDKIGVNIDCSRFANTYDGYRDEREWFMSFEDGEIDIDVYLNNISDEKLQKMVDNI